MSRGDFVDLESLPCQQAQSYFEERLRHIVQYAYDNAPFVRRKLDKVGLEPSRVQSIADLERVPFTSKEEIIATQIADPPFGGLITKHVNELEAVYISPGPIYEPLPPTEGMTHFYKSCGLKDSDVVILPLSFHMVPGGALHEVALRKLGATVVPTGPGNTEFQLVAMKQLGVTAYVGFPRFLLSIIDRAKDLGYNVTQDFKVKKAFLVGEMFTDSMRHTLEDRYGIETWEFYGTADVGLVGYECSARAGLHIIPSLIVEIVDSVTGKQLSYGEVGEIVITTFREEYPLIRYRTEDLGYCSAEPCQCGRKSPRLMDVLGRIGEAPRVRGLFLTPQEVARAVSNFHEIAAFQLIVESVGLRDELTLRVEGDISDLQKLEETLKNSFKSSTRLTLDKVERAPKGTIPGSGKIIVDERVWK